jgi:hypothetical protein
LDGEKLLVVLQAHSIVGTSGIYWKLPPTPPRGGGDISYHYLKYEKGEEKNKENMKEKGI